MGKASDELFHGFAREASGQGAEHDEAVSVQMSAALTAICRQVGSGEVGIAMYSVTSKTC